MRNSCGSIRAPTRRTNCSRRHRGPAGRRGRTRGRRLPSAGGDQCRRRSDDPRAGLDRTILNFATSTSAAGLTATGDAFVLEDLAIEDNAGNAAAGSDGVVFRRCAPNGPTVPREQRRYGSIRSCRNVLIDECVAIGASDAGIYVGQSDRILVKDSRAEYNVAGIEIENSTNAEVIGCVATNNTGGILVFDLPGLQVVNGGEVLVHGNTVFGNNHPNFAPEGNIVGTASGHRRDDHRPGRGHRQHSRPEPPTSRS